jgi:iron complex outermembrane recepter protein
MRFALRAFAALFVCGTSLIWAQQELTVQWKLTLQDLEQRLATLPDSGEAVAAWRDDAEALRSAIAEFARANPADGIEVPRALPEGSPKQALKDQFDGLSAAVQQVIDKTPGSPFNLGHVQVDVSATLAEDSPVTVGIDQTTIAQLDLVNAAKALDYLPGVDIQHISANRNEAGIMVRGFSTRGQVPLYIDGIPISVPYDGYVDFNRYLTSDISDIEVARGYSTPLLGPNALGGSINMVTEEPVKKFDADALIGGGSGDTLLSSLRLGSRTSHFFYQASLDWLQNDYIPLSGNFPVYQYTNLPGFTMTSHLNNSWARDERFTGRVGWTPRRGQYVLSWINLKGQKGVPLYQGPDTTATFRNFWVWPYWNTQNFYANTNTEIGEKSNLIFRGFYTQFRNDIDMYSNDTYTVMNTKSAEHSMYNEHNAGFSSEYTNRAVPHNVFSASFFLKDDTHTEHGIYPGISPFPLIEPVLRDADIQTSIGLQDVVRILPKLSVTGGFSADHFDGLQGQQYNSAMTALLPFTCIASPDNTAFSGCTAHVWNYNPQVAVNYDIEKSGSIFFTFAHRSRFPMLKDIYSASLGAGLPNPNLLPEHNDSWNLGYRHTFGARTVAQVVLFHDRVHDAIESVYVTDPGGSNPATEYCPNSKIIGYCSEMANIGNETHEGLEFEVKSAPIPRLTLDLSYSFLNRDLQYDFSELPNVSAVNTSITILPTLPRNKFVGTASFRFPHQILAIVNERYESGLLLQDTTYATNSPQFLPYSESYATTNIFAMIPVAKGFTLQAGIKNLLDRNYYYTAGYPEEGRNWIVNLRYHF